MKKHYYAITLAMGFLLVVSCSRSFPSGTYGARYDQTDSNGSLHELVVRSAGDHIEAAHYLIRNAAGDIDRARMQAAEPLMAALVEEQSVPRKAPAGAEAAFSWAQPLMKAAFARAKSGRTGWDSVERSVTYRAESWAEEGGTGTASMAIEMREGSIADVKFEMPGAPDEDVIRRLERALRDAPDLDKAAVFAVGEDLHSGADAETVDTFRILAARALDLAELPEPIEAARVQELAKSSAVSTLQLPDGPPHNREEAVVSAHYLATRAGMRVLEAGGTAADAAFAVAAVLSVVESWFSSVLGGGTWALYYDRAAGRVYSLDGVGTLGTHATADAYRELAGQDGLHQSIVPGAWDGWMIWLKRFGLLPLGELLEDAIGHAENGIPASADMARWINIEFSYLSRYPKPSEIYLRNGQPPEPGEIIYNRDMAETFRTLVRAYDEAAALRGRRAAFDVASDYYYRGPLARRITEFSHENGGFFELPDFYRFYAEIVEPLSIDYRGIRVYENPPNSQGITMLIALNILKRFDLSGYTVDSPEAVHLQVESIKLAHVDKYYHVGDPAYVDVPVEELLSEEHAERRRDQISLDRALTWPIEDVLGAGHGSGGSHTTTFHVVDRYGNAAAVTTSLGAQFMVIGDTGIHINNRMRMVSVEEGNPNYAEPGKKVRHTSNPYMAFRNGRPYILGGNTGVDTQPQGQLQQFVSVVEFGLGPQEAVARPRWVARAYPAGSQPWAVANDLGMEPGTPEELREALAAIGHTISAGGVWGSANMIVIDPETGQVETGADPRGGVGEGRSRPISTR